MKKSFIIFLLLFFTSYIFASSDTYNISISLILNENDINEIKTSDKALTLLKDESNLKFSNFEINCLNSVYNLCNQYISSINLSKKFINSKIDTMKFDSIYNQRKKIEDNYILYSTKLDPSILDKIKGLKENSLIKETSINEINPKFSQIQNSLAFSILTKSNDKNIINVLLDKYDSDGFLFVSIDEISNYKKLKLEYIDKDSRQIIYNKIITNNLIKEIEEDILTSLIIFFNPEYSLCSLKDINNIISIDEIISLSKQRLDKIDNNDFSSQKVRNNDLLKLNINNDYIILKKGVHYLLIKDMTNSKIEKINIENNIYKLKLNGEKKINESLNIISENGMVDLYLNGRYIDNTTSLNLKNIDLPFYIEAMKNSYNTEIIQYNKSLDKLSLDLKPAWQTQTSTINIAQDEFYSSLLSYILIHFTTLSINTINDSINNIELEESLEVFSKSISVFSSINIINKLISYIKIASD